MCQGMDLILHLLMFVLRRIGLIFFGLVVIVLINFVCHVDVDVGSSLLEDFNAVVDVDVVVVMVVVDAVFKNGSPKLELCK
jgi:hypothetical protein